VKYRKGNRVESKEGNSHSGLFYELLLFDLGMCVCVRKSIDSIVIVC
jgi:hypothetical protein